MRGSGLRTGVTAAILLATWIILSGLFDPLHLGTGVVAAILVALAFPGWADAVRFRPLRFLLYLPWLTGQILRSNLRVARVVLSPKMPIAPTFIAQAPGVRGERALTVLGSSITLTPGTLTIDIDDERLFVHALDPASAQDVRDGTAARRIARIFEADAT